MSKGYLKMTSNSGEDITEVTYYLNQEDMDELIRIKNKLSTSDVLDFSNRCDLAHKMGFILYRSQTHQAIEVKPVIVRPYGQLFKP